MFGFGFGLVSVIRGGHHKGMCWLFVWQIWVDRSEILQDLRSYRFED